MCPVHGTREARHSSVREREQLLYERNHLT